MSNVHVLMTENQLLLHWGVGAIEIRGHHDPREQGSDNQWAVKAGG